MIGRGSIRRLFHIVCARAQAMVIAVQHISNIERGQDLGILPGPFQHVSITPVFQRHAGWIAGSAGLAAEQPGDAPHIILFPEIAFDRESFLQRVRQTVDSRGFCVIVASEGTQYENGRFLAESGSVDAFGHTQLGGVAPTLAALIKSELGYKNHWAVADYLQRSARHIASATDVEQAYAVGKAAVEMVLQGKNSVMPTIVRLPGKKYHWKIGEAHLNEVANIEKKMPRDFICPDGFGITDKGLAYFKPLIQGEDYPPYTDGMPRYARLKKVFLSQKLPDAGF